MKPTEQCWSSQQIDDYLKEGLSKSVQIEFEQHVGVCDRCRQELESKAAGPEVWNDAVALLAHSPSDSSVDSGEASYRRRAAGVLDSLAPTDDPEMLGRIGEYEVSGVVGVGGMGAVLKGFDRSLGRVVAIKVMAPHLADNGSARTRFQREARAAAAIMHDNVIDIYGVAESNGLPYLVMPYARGPSLQKRIDEGGPLSATEVVRIGRQIADGLAAAHEQGLVHRDIKPANILLSDGIERLWITDFGVARCMDDASMTKTGIIAGTPQYMSPEQARGEEVDQRSDLFSLGSILYTSCTGRPPFRSEAAYGILRRITDTDPRPVREINPDIPEWLCRVIERMMAKHPADRFGTADEVAELLENCLAHMQQPTLVDLPQSISVQRREAELAQRPQGQETAVGLTALTSSRFLRTGVWIMISALLLAGCGVLALQISAPADVSGRWSGETWQSVSLSTVEEAVDWYAGTLTDADGRRGAVQLEWSRLQRRYNGRWKISDEQSGSITLRVGDDGAVQGAISVDPGSSITENTPMLREFHWKRSDTETAADGPSPASPSAKASTLSSPFPVRSPTDGFVSKFSDQIALGAEVKKGDFIARIQPLDTAIIDQLTQELTNASRQVSSNEVTLKASVRNMESSQEVVQAFLAQLKTLEQLKKQAAKSRSEAVLAAEKTTKVAGQRVSAAEEQQKRSEQEAKIAKVSAERGIISRQELQIHEDKVNKSKVMLDVRRNALQNAEHQMAVVRDEALVKEQLAQVDIDAAMISLKKAQADYVKSEGEVKKTQSALKSFEQQVSNIQLRISQMQRIELHAPRTGKLTMVAEIAKGKTLNRFELICVIQPVRPTKETPQKPAVDSGETPKQ